MSDLARHQLAMTSPPDDVDAVHEMIARVWDNSPDVPLADRIRFETALIELISNVVRHADSGTGVTCVLTIDVLPASVEARVTDTGEGGDIELTRVMMPDDDAESGRGLALINSLVDEVQYERINGRNYWRISRTLGS